MMSCPDCQTNLDQVPVGDPCPTCGGMRRDAVVTPPTANAIARVFTHEVTHSTDAVLTKDDALTFLVRLESPGSESDSWFTELMTADGRLLAASASDDRVAAILESAMQMESETGEAEEPKEPHRDDLPDV